MLTWLSTMNYLMTFPPVRLLLFPFYLILRLERGTSIPRDKTHSYTLTYSTESTQLIRTITLIPQIDTTINKHPRHYLNPTLTALSHGVYSPSMKPSVLHLRSQKAKHYDSTTQLALRPQRGASWPASFDPATNTGLCLHVQASLAR